MSPQEELGVVRVSSPVLVTSARNMKRKMDVDSHGEPYLITDGDQKNATDEQSAAAKALQKSAAASSNYRGLHTMSISLFDESLFKNPNQVSPFRQSNSLKGNQMQLLANLEAIANLEA